VTAVRRWHLAAVVAVGALLRLLLLRGAAVWYDEATSGLTGLAVLRGELPVYFSGQPFMGTAGDAYLTAPVFALLGVSARTLELTSVLIGIAWLALVVRLAADAYGRRAALFTALVLALPPEYQLYWVHEGRPHYPLPMLLGALALHVALRLPVVAPRRAVLHGGLLGLVLGLAYWTNMLSVVFFPAAALLVLRRGLGPGLRPAAPAGVVGFLLGSLPHWLYAIPHGSAIPPAGGHVRLADLRVYAEAAVTLAWPRLMGVPAELLETRASLAVGAALLVVYALAAVAALRAVRRDRPPGGAATAALLVLTVTNVALAVGTQYGRFLLGDARYLMPLYTALPPLLGRWLAGLPSWRIAAAVVGALLVVNVTGGVGGQLDNLRPRGAPLAALTRRQLATVAALERQGLTRLYAPDFATRVYTFLSAERVIFANHYEEIVPRHARAVDGAERVAWWSEGRAPGFEANLAALGVQARWIPATSEGGVYTDFTLPPRGLRELDPARWSVTASDGGVTARWAADRDVGTMWTTARSKRGGEWLQVDLGAVEPVTLVRWLPGTYQEVPDGITLEVSTDGARWERVLHLPEYAGPLYWSAGRPMGRVRSARVELRIPPTPARHVRITQLGSSVNWHWTVRELFVYAAAPDAPPPPATIDGARLAGALRAAGVERLYADHGWSARVALAEPAIRVLPANLALDAYGFTGPAEAFWPVVRWTPGAGALVEAADAPSFAAVARATGLGFAETRVAGLVLFAWAPAPVRPGGALPGSAFTLTASRHAELAHLAVDGDRRTRWATGGPQAAGDWVRIDFPSPRAVRALALWTASATDSPRELALEGTEDGVTWRPLTATIQRTGPLRWSGIGLLRDGTERVRLDFAPARLASVRAVLTAGDPVFDWSIHELTVFAP
jgi:hypothetical protein